MQNETHQVAPEQQVYAPVNRLYRYPDIVGPETAGNLRAPNNDTLYYNGWMISRKIGRYGFSYMHRASVARGGYGNLP